MSTLTRELLDLAMSDIEGSTGALMMKAIKEIEDLQLRLVTSETSIEKYQTRALSAETKADESAKRAGAIEDEFIAYRNKNHTCHHAEHSHQHNSSSRCMCYRCLWDRDSKLGFWILRLTQAVDNGTLKQIQDASRVLDDELWRSGYDPDEKQPMERVRNEQGEVDCDHRTCMCPDGCECCDSVCVGGAAPEVKP